jgi:hypothetical protein
MSLSPANATLFTNCKSKCSPERCANDPERRADCAKKCPKEKGCKPERPQKPASDKPLTIKQAACLVPLITPYRAFSKGDLLKKNYEKKCPDDFLPAYFFDPMNLFCLSNVLWDAHYRAINAHIKPQSPETEELLEDYEDLLKDVSREHHQKCHWILQKLSTGAHNSIN